MFLVALLLGMGWLGACGQKLMVLGGSTDFLLMKASRIRDSMQIDRSLLTVRYRFSTAHPSPGGSPVWCDILVQVGERYIKQTDLCLHYDCLIWTAPAASEPLFAAREKAGIRPSNLFSEIVCDRESREMQVICGDFFPGCSEKIYTTPSANHLEAFRGGTDDLRLHLPQSRGPLRRSQLDRMVCPRDSAGNRSLETERSARTDPEGDRQPGLYLRLCRDRPTSGARHAV